MRCREMLAFYAGIAVLLMISAFTLGSSAQTLQTVGTAPHSHAVSVFDGSGPNTPLEGVDGDVTLQHRHKAGSTTASPPVQAGCSLRITGSSRLRVGSRPAAFFALRIAKPCPGPDPSLLSELSDHPPAARRARIARPVQHLRPVDSASCVTLGPFGERAPGTLPLISRPRIRAITSRVTRNSAVISHVNGPRIPLPESERALWNSGPKRYEAELANTPISAPRLIPGADAHAVFPSRLGAA